MLPLNTLALRALAALIALAAACATGYAYGQRVIKGEIAQEQLKTGLAYAARISEQQTTADELNAQNTALRQAAAPKTHTITREIIRYESTTPPAQRCALPGAWRLLHDAAATGQPATAETGPLVTAEAAPVADAAALATVGANYATCREVIAQLEGWQNRYHALEETP